MHETLNVLQVEDSESDADLIRRILERAGCTVRSERVDDEAQMRAALARRSWDVVLCDYSLPQFDAHAALKMLRESDPDTPFIVVSGTIGEDVAVKMMKSGAQDYLMKNNLARLPAAVGREMTEVRLRREWRRGQSALREKELLLRAVCENAADYILVKDLDGRIVFANPAALDALGKASHEVIGQTDNELYGAGFAPAIVENDRRVMQHGNAQSVEERVQAREGTRTYISTKTPWRDGDGQVVGLVTISRDITEPKRAEEKLRQSEQRERERANELEAIMDALPLAAFISRDPECRTVFGNRRTYETLRRAAGTNLFEPESPARPMGLRIMRAGSDVPPEHLPMQVAARTRCAVENYSCEFVLEDGARRHMIGNAVPLLDANGHPRGSVAAFMDVTKRHEAEHALARSNDDLQRFAYAVSHDLREPLRTVAGFTELLSKRCKGQLNGEADELMQFVLDGVHRLDRMITDLLDYSRVGGSSAASLEEVSAERSLEEALTNLQAVIDESGATVTHTGLPSVNFHRSQLTRLFQNLIGNAIKYRRAGAPPAIHIAARAGQQGWEFSVGDNGIGFPSGDAKRIFDVFTRLHGNEYPGTGVGLAICKRIVERHHGHIWADSEVGVGSTFHFSVPQ